MPRGSSSPPIFSAMVGRTCRVPGHLCSSFLDFHHLVQKSSFIALMKPQLHPLLCHFHAIPQQHQCGHRCGNHRLPPALPSSTSHLVDLKRIYRLPSPWSQSPRCLKLHTMPCALSWTESKGFIDPVSQELGLFDHRRSQEQHGGIAGSWIRTLTIHMLISSVPCVTNTDHPQIETIPMHRCSSTIHKNKHVTLPLNILQYLSTYPKIFGFIKVPSVQLGRNDFHWAETGTTSWTSTEERRHGLANPDKLQIKTQW